MDNNNDFRGENENFWIKIFPKNFLGCIISLFAFSVFGTSKFSLLVGYATLGIGVIGILKFYGWGATILVLVGNTLLFILFGYYSALDYQISGKEDVFRVFLTSTWMKFLFFLLLIISSLLLTLAPKSIYSFLKELWAMISNRKTYVPMLNLVVTFIVIVILFGFIYSTIYVVIGHDAFRFQIDRPPETLDFFYYSLLVPTVFGSTDLIPNAPITKIVTTIEIFIGIIIFVLYLGVIIGEISDIYPRQESGE